MTDDEIRAANRATLERSFGAVSKGDVDAQLEFCTEDLEIRFPYSDPPGHLQGKETIRPYLKRALTTFEFELHLDRIYDLVDPNVLIAEYTSAGRVTTTGKPYANAYVGIVHFRDGQICAQVEYYNPQAAVRALTPD
jgi:ketosteroid isomerase-like protein